MFAATTFVPHVSIREGRTLERLLARHEVAPLGGAVVEATYAASDPPLLPRLKALRIPYALDPQTIRFGGRRFLGMRSLSGLPYAPSSPVPDSPSSAAFDEVIRGALQYQEDHEVDLYMTPSVPMLKPTLSAVKSHRRTHGVAAGFVGSRPLLAAVSPTLAVMRSPFAVYEPLQDRAFDGIYVQPIRLNAKTDSVEWLATYVQFLLMAHEYNLPVVAARAGSFGLVLTSLGVDSFDAGLGDRESFNLRALERERKLKSSTEEEGGMRRRGYVRPLLTSLDSAQLAALLRSPTIAPRLECNLEPCRFRDFTEQLRNPREHFFHVREAELRELRDLPTVSMRVQHMHTRLLGAIETGKLANQCLAIEGLPPVSFGHLENWLAVLARVATRVATGSGR